MYVDESQGDHGNLKLGQENAAGAGLIDEVTIPLKPNAAIGSSVLSSIFVLANSILGAGMLGLPAAFAECGFLTGVIMLSLFAFFSAVGLHLLSAASDRAGRPASFYSLAQQAGGPRAGVFIDVCIALNSFGVATSYLIVVGDTMPEVAEGLGASGTLAKPYFWKAIALALAGSLSYLREISALRYSAILAFAAVLFIAFVAFIFAAAPATFSPCLHPHCAGKTQLTTDVAQTFTSLPVFIFAFTCHQAA